jgi:caffeoyl-CoA O-methyltransferase
METRPIADPDLEAYAAAHSSPEPDWLGAVAATTHEATPRHPIMGGHLVGRLLGLLVAFARPSRILEFGTFTGYSALSMAHALPSWGRIVTLEVDPGHAALARRNIDRTAFGDRIDIRVGPALETVCGLQGPFELVFIDADKPGYIAYYEAALPLVPSGGLIIADGTLWSGRVLDADPDDRDTAAIVAFNEHVATDPRVETVMLTIRDGVTIIRKR